MMKKVLLFLVMVCLVSQSLAFTVTRDGVLSEWVGNEINNLGTVAAPDGGSYTLLAVWDGTVLNLAIDRDSSNRYLGDTGWDNDSFFIAFDTDGISGSGMTTDGYARVHFEGPMLPDVIYYFAGGPTWYERSVWNGISDWDWMGWTDANAFYGQSETYPNDELTPDLVSQASWISGADELLVWAWMSRESNGWIEASWPQGYTGSEPNMVSPMKIRDAASLLYMPHDPIPTLGQEDVAVSALELSWAVSQDTGGVVNPSLASHKLYMSDGTDDHNLVFVDTVSSWDANLIASYTPSPELDKNGLYFWRVDMVMTDTSEVTGDVWSFYTESSIAEINDITPYQIIEASSTAVFTIVVDSVSTPTYQWYKYVDGISDTMLADGGDISGSATDSLSIGNVESADEGYYYCIVNNDSGIPVTSQQLPLAIKGRIAYWDFELGNANSIISGSPVSVLYGDPNFTTAGIVGDAMEFDNDANSEDILYTNPDEASYFDICNYNMTVCCWIKSTFAATWGPIVARNGEDNGWQLRHRGDTLDRICFTTRSTGNDDGTASTSTVYNGDWHYVVATYDGSVKKVYIDGVLSRLYSVDDGSVAQEYDTATGAISASLSPVALAGRVKGDPIGGLEFEGYSVTPCVLDEVEIYNYALDADFIAQSYADISGNSVCPDPTVPAYDLDDNCVVDMRDFALLASEWLEDSSVAPAP